MSHGPLADIARLVDARTIRFSSYDRTGGNADYTRVEAGETKTLAQVDGAGIVKHIWFTILCDDPLIRRNLVLRMFWDGSPHPSVESPIGDFFGQGWGLKYNFSSLPLAAAPAGGNALVCYFPMPFGSGARIEVENQGPEPVTHLYFYIDVERHGAMADDIGRFHASYRQELTKPETAQGDIENEWEAFGEYVPNQSDANNYVFCECEGKGHFVGVNYFVNSPTPLWYGEGDDMFLVDGEPWPGSAHGTGTEDYFNMSWCPKEPFQHPYFGFGRVPGFGNDSPTFGWLGRTHVYRFHLEDPIRFQKSLRASIEHGHANALTLEIATVAYWYQAMPSRPLPSLPPASERVPRPELTPLDVHRWRSVWRESKGGGAQWG